MPACDKCAAAKSYLGEMGISGAVIDLSASEGVREFREYYKNLKGQIKRNEDGSLPIPTILFFDDNNEVVSIAHNVDQIKKIV